MDHHATVSQTTHALLVLALVALGANDVLNSHRPSLLMVKAESGSMKASLKLASIGGGAHLEIGRCATQEMRVPPIPTARRVSVPLPADQVYSTFGQDQAPPQHDQTSMFYVTATFDLGAHQ